MSSKSTENDTDGLKKALFPLDENGDILFNFKNLEHAMKSVQQLALKCIKLSATDNELKEANEQERKTNVEVKMLMGLEAVEKKKLITPHELEEIETNAICILRWLIELLGHKLTADEIDEIIAQGENNDIELEKILSILDKEKENEEDALMEFKQISEMNIQTLKRRMICLGIISKAIAKSMTEDDLIDMLLSVDKCKDQSGNAEEPKDCETLQKSYTDYKRSLYEMRNIISTFGSVLINKAHTLSESNIEHIMEKDEATNESVLPKMIFRLIEKELRCGEDNDILQKFCALDQRGNGFVTLENFKETVMGSSEPPMLGDIEEFLKGTETNEFGEVNYLQYVSSVNQKKK